MSEFSWSSVGSALAKAGITGLSTALLGPAGPTVSGLLCGWLGLDASSPDAPSMVEQAITDPNILANLKIKAMEHEAEITRLHLTAETNRLQIELDNVKSAREREAKITETGSATKWATTVVSAVVTVGFFVILWEILWGQSSMEENQAALLLLGSMSTAFGAVINYYLGSSQGSARKDALLAQAPSVGGGK